MRNRVSVTVPSALLSEFILRSLIQEAIVQAGGATVAECQGRWYDDEAREYNEQVTVYHMWYDEDVEPALNEAVNRVIDFMHGAGEKAVFVETLSATLAGQVQRVHIIAQEDDALSLADLH